MAKEKHSRIRRSSGCLTGCLTRLIALLGFVALLFVSVHLLGFVHTDQETGQPVLELGNGSIQIPFDLKNGLNGLPPAFPTWPFGIRSEGMTLKILRAGKGRALLLCCDGYTAIIGGGSSNYAAGIQMLLCGVNRLDAAIAQSSDKRDTGGMPFAIRLGKPSYLFYTDTQERTSHWQDMVEKARRIQCEVPKAGLSFTLGRGRVTFIGPTRTGHADDVDDSLSLRVDYGSSGILIPGRITREGETELLASGAKLSADVLITNGSREEGATEEAFIAAAAPRIAVCTGDKDSLVIERFKSAGIEVYPSSEHGIMTIYSDGTELRMIP